MGRVRLPTDVFSAAVERMAALYREGHRIVVSVSGGKDSTVAVNICRIAAAAAGAGPVECVTRDEEVAFPGTYEYLERLAQEPDIRLTWLLAEQPVINLFNRTAPYFWVFDSRLAPEQWVRRPPSWATVIAEKSIDQMTIPARFPPPAGRTLFAVVGLRVAESRGRLYGLFNSGGYLTQANRYGVRNARPIYDWQDADVWKAIAENGWDYNAAYNTFHRLGVARAKLRIGPPTMTVPGIELLGLAARGWPAWFDRVCARLPGARTAAQFGRRALEPVRRRGETWEACFRRECLGEERAPAWIRDRAATLLRKLSSMHRHHATTPLPEVDPCHHCQSNIGSWRNLSLAMYGGDPFSMKQQMLPYVEPEFFRAGAGTWGGSPSF